MDMNLDQLSYEEFESYAELVRVLTEDWVQSRIKIMNAEKEYGLSGHIADENLISDDDEEEDEI